MKSTRYNFLRSDVESFALSVMEYCNKCSDDIWKFGKPMNIGWNSKEGIATSRTHLIELQTESGKGIAKLYYNKQQLKPADRVLIERAKDDLLILAKRVLELESENETLKELVDYYKQPD